MSAPNDLGFSRFAGFIIVSLLFVAITMDSWVPLLAALGLVPVYQLQETLTNSDKPTRKGKRTR